MAHRLGVGSKYTNKHECRDLIYCEWTDHPINGIAGEHELKGWRREKKMNLIQRFNPTLEDLSHSIDGSIRVFRYIPKHRNFNKYLQRSIELRGLSDKSKNHAR
jgi:hypothetical protein